MSAKSRESQTSITGSTRLGERGWRGRRVRLMRRKVTRGGAVFAFGEVLTVDKALNGRLELRDDIGTRCINGVPMWQVELLPTTPGWVKDACPERGRRT